MLRLALVLLAAVLLSAGAMSCGGGGEDGAAELPFAPLDFPFAEPEDIRRMAAFGIPDWSGSEPHNGIDLVVDDALERTAILTTVHAGA